MRAKQIQHLLLTRRKPTLATKKEPRPTTVREAQDRHDLERLDNGLKRLNNALKRCNEIRALEEVIPFQVRTLDPAFMARIRAMLRRCRPLPPTTAVLPLDSPETPE